MTSRDPREVAARIKAETGIDVLDTSQAHEAARAGRRTVVRWVGAALAGGAGLFALVLAVVPGNPGVGVRISFAAFGIVCAALAVWLGITAFLPTEEHRRLVRPRREAQRRFQVETGMTAPGLLADSSAFTRAVFAASSTPGEVEQMHRDRDEVRARRQPEGGGDGGPRG